MTSMDRSPLVSVLMPAYNQVQYISEALDSLQRQTYKNWEVAIVDDGSPDNVAEVVAKYVASDPRIRFYHTENHGLSGARNYAASVTSGKYIIPLDADDIFEPEYIEKCVQEFEKNPELKVVYCDWQMFGVTTNTPPLAYHGYRKLLVGNTIFCSGMYHREDFEKIGGYDTKIPFGYEDWDFWISLLDDEAQVYQIPEKLFRYRMKANSMIKTLKKDENERITKTYIYNKHKEVYDQYFPDFITLLQQLQYFEYRNEKWKKRSLASRLWHALKGTI